MTISLALHIKFPNFKTFRIINQSTDYDVKSKEVENILRYKALVHGISRALLQFDENFKPTLRKKNLQLEDLDSMKEKTEEQS